MDRIFQRKKGLWKSIRNLWSYSLGNRNSCPGCGDKFDLHSWISIDYSPGRNMMPICKDCFERLEVRQIVYLCEELVRQWRRQGSERKWSDMRRNVEDKVIKMKGE